MKRTRITYWTTTGFLSLMMLLSAYAYLANDEVKAGFQHLGFPSYFRIELAIAKMIGAFILLIPIVKGRLKEWAYAGYFIVFVSAFIAHTASGDPAGKCVAPLLFLVMLCTSYYTYTQLGKVANS